MNQLCVGENFSVNWDISLFFLILMLFQDEKNIATPKIKLQMQEMRGRAVKNLRANEIRVTKHAVLKTNWADDKNLFLMGHSEGGAGVSFSRESGFRAVVSSGFKCGKPHPVKKKLPIRVSQQTPILFIYYKNDPWFDYDNCKGFVKTRNNAALLELKGSKHETSSNKIARDAVEEFFAKYQY